MHKQYTGFRFPASGTAFHRLMAGLAVVCFCSLCLLCLAPANGAEPQLQSTAQDSGSVLVGMTAPRRTVTLATLHQGRIESLPVREGQPVQAGHVVIVLDDDVQRVRTEILRSEAESSLQIELARAAMDKAQNELDRLVQLSGHAHATSKELADARAEAEITRLRFQFAMFEQEQAILKYHQEELILDQHRVLAPFTGYVSEHLKHEGEIVEEREGILTLVELDPLEVVVDCPVSMAMHISEGQTAWVRPDDERWPPREAKVILANRVADAGSQTFKAKLIVDNMDGEWISGLKVAVDFATGGDRRVPPDDTEHPALTEVVIADERSERTEETGERANKSSNGGD